MALFPFLRKSSPDKTAEIEQINYSYQAELNRIRHIWELWNATPAEKVAFLDFAIQVIGNDVQCQHFAQFFYEQVESGHLVQDLIPIDRVVPVRRTHENFSLDKHLVFTIPYDLKKIRDAGRDIDGEGYRPHPQDNVDGFYIPEFNAVFIINGRHHVAAAKSKGIPCFAKRIEEYSLENAFFNLNVSAHGGAWLFKDSQSHEDRRVNVIDPRIAFMYDLAKERDSLKKSCLTSNLPSAYI